MSDCDNKRKKKGLKPCKPSQICNPKTNRCVSRTGNVGKKILGKSKSRSLRSKSKSKSRRKSMRKSKSRSRRKSVSKSKSRSVRKSKSQKYHNKDSRIVMETENGKTVMYRIWYEPLSVYNERQKLRSKKEPRRILHKVRMSRPKLQKRSNKIRLDMIPRVLGDAQLLEMAIQNPNIIFFKGIHKQWVERKKAMMKYFENGRTFALSKKFIIADYLVNLAGKSEPQLKKKYPSITDPVLVKSPETKRFLLGKLMKSYLKLLVAEFNDCRSAHGGTQNAKSCPRAAQLINEFLTLMLSKDTMVPCKKITELKKRCQRGENADPIYVLKKHILCDIKKRQGISQSKLIVKENSSFDLTRRIKTIQKFIKVNLKPKALSKSNLSEWSGKRALLDMDKVLCGLGDIISRFI